MVRSLMAAALIVASLAIPHAEAQTVSRGQAASPGQSRAMNRLPQPPSGGVATGRSVVGPKSGAQRRAEEAAKKSTAICKGC